nr:hypothetical protein CFP56_17512 [Quercus suber]
MDSPYPLSKVDYYPKIDGVNVIEAFGSVEPTSYPSLPPECLEDPPHPESMTFKYFLSHLPTDSKEAFWEFDPGDLLNRLRIRHENLMVYHPSKVLKDGEANLGRMRDLVHYRYMMASVVKKYLKPCDISEYFTLGFSELFLQPQVDKTHFYNSFGCQVQKYGYSYWWKKVENETPESMLGHVYRHEGRPFKNGSALPTYLRNLHAHYDGATQAINDATEASFKKKMDEIYDYNSSIEAEMAELKDDDSLKEKLRAKIIVQLEKPKLESLPLHSELEPIITERFPGVYSCMVDAIIRAFAVNANAEIPFRCSISELLFLKGPFGDNHAYKWIYFQDT